MVRPKVVVTWFEGDGLRAELAERRVHPGLRGLVVDWFGYREVAAQPVYRRQVPAATVTVYFGFGAPPQLYRGGGGQQLGATPGAFVAGPHDSAVLSASAVGMGVVQAQLTPLAAYSLFGVPVHELAGVIVDLVNVMGRLARQLPARLADAPDWPARFALLDDVLTAGIAAGPAPDPAVEFAWRCLCRSGGRCDIGAVAEAVGWSRRHLARRFGEQVGMPPKQAARTLRLQQAIRLLRRPSPAPLADVAAACGYYDQAHLNLDFRAIVGATPTGLRAEEAALRGRLGAGTTSPVPW